MKKCSTCKVEKDDCEFSKCKTKKDGLDPRCKECQKIRSKAFYLKNTEKINQATKAYYKNNTEKVNAITKAYYTANSEKSFASKLKHNYQMTVKDYYLLLEQQNGVCAICGRECLTGERLSVDHSHTSGRVRGLLCRKCNSALGLFNDSPATLSKALEYLKSRLI